MHVVSKKKLRDFWEQRPEAKTPLLAWYKNAKKAHWTKFADVRAVFPSADRVGKCIVFNIGGNKYRLIVIIPRGWHRVLVRFIMTHREYDKENWLSDCC